MEGWVSTTRPRLNSGPPPTHGTGRVGWGRGFHVAPQAGIAQSRPEFANWRPTHRLDPASRCVLFGPHGVFKKLAYLPTFINGNILHKNPEIWLLLENRLSSHSQSAFHLEQQQTGEKPPALWVQPVLSGSPQQRAQPLLSLWGQACVARGLS